MQDYFDNHNSLAYEAEREARRENRDRTSIIDTNYGPTAAELAMDAGYYR